MTKKLNIYLWKQQFKDTDEWRSLQAALSLSELNRVNQFKSESRRNSFVAGRYLLRQIFNSMGAVSPESFTSEEYKKPSAPVLPQFNLSHTFGLVAAAVGAEAPLGLDVESNSDQREVMRFINEYGTSEEVEILSKVKGLARDLLFYKIWSLKESYAKATGDGLSKNLQKLKFDIINNKILQTPTAGPCVFYYFQYENTHVSLCELTNESVTPTVFIASKEGDALILKELKNVHFEKFVIVVPGIAANH